eukprot:1158666-Pelagomonas_calceolata.AAC.3
MAACSYVMEPKLTGPITSNNVCLTGGASGDMITNTQKRSAVRPTRYARKSVFFAVLPLFPQLSALPVCMNWTSHAAQTYLRALTLYARFDLRQLCDRALRSLIQLKSTVLGWPHYETVGANHPSKLEFVFSAAAADAARNCVELRVNTSMSMAQMAESSSISRRIPMLPKGLTAPLAVLVSQCEHTKTLRKECRHRIARSEEFLKEYMQKAGNKEPVDIQVATKYFPLPWRLTSSSVPDALRASLARLGLPRISLYQQHWWVACHLLCPYRPGLGLNSLLNDAYIDGLAQCKQQLYNIGGGAPGAWSPYAWGGQQELTLKEKSSVPTRPPSVKRTVSLES